MHSAGGWIIDTFLGSAEKNLYFLLEIDCISLVFTFVYLNSAESLKQFFTPFISLSSPCTWTSLRSFRVLWLKATRSSPLSDRRWRRQENIKSLINKRRTSRWLVYLFVSNLFHWQLWTVLIYHQMTKKIKKLEKETTQWRTKWESNNQALLQMAEEVFVMIHILSLNFCR